jgi:hypothetical protein
MASFEPGASFRSQLLTRCGLQQLELGLVVRRPQVVDLPPTTPERVHDPHPDAVFAARAYGDMAQPYGSHPRISVQIRPPRAMNPQVNDLRPSQVHDRDKSQAIGRNAR